MDIISNNLKIDHARREMKEVAFDENRKKIDLNEACLVSIINTWFLIPNKNCIRFRLVQNREWKKDQKERKPILIFGSLDVQKDYIEKEIAEI